MKIIILFLLGFTINAQNLVPNPSFETYSNCPNGLGEIFRAVSWNNANNHTGSSDYFNGCSQLISGSSVPSNFCGSQVAFQGMGYAGILTYFSYIPVREYIQAHLTSPLIAGQTYYVSFYVSCAENNRYATNKIGIILTVNPVNGNGEQTALNITPNIWSEAVITDTTNWTLISGTYLASGNEQYITIGNFFNDSTTQVVVNNPNANTYTTAMAYYYVDQVIVSTSQMENNQFQFQKAIVTPNPVIDEFTLNGEENNDIIQIELYSQYCKVKDFNVLNNKFNIKELPSGIYYLLVTYSSKKRTSAKIIKL